MKKRYKESLDCLRECLAECGFEVVCHQHFYSNSNSVENFFVYVKRDLSDFSKGGSK